MLTLRAPTHEDIPELLLLANEQQLEAGRPQTTTAKDLENDWHAPGQDRERLHRVAVIDDRIVATSSIWLDAPMAWASIYVSAPFRRQGIATSLWRWADPTLRGLDGVTFATAGVNSRHKGALDFLQSVGGFAKERSFLRMRHEAPSQVAAPDPLDGVELYQPEDLISDTVRLRNASFVDHWGYHPWIADAVKHRIEVDREDTTLWTFAKLDGDPAGLCMTSISKDNAGNKYGYLGPIGTLPQYRGRGVARFLLRHSMAQLAQRDVRHVTLWVDSQSPFEATKLYTNHGFSIESEWLHYRLDLSKDATPAAQRATHPAL